MAKEAICGLMESFTLANGKTIRCMVQGYIVGPMEENTKVNI